MNNAESLAHMSGETAFKRPRLLTLDELSMNGNEGKFYITRFTKEKDASGKYLKEELGTTPLAMVFMKIRRKLTEFDGDGIVRSTIEHSTPNDQVTLFEARTNTMRKGIARDFREEHEKMRTVQVVYCYNPDDGSVYKLNIKGMSLGSKEQPKGELSFYEYLSSYAENDHVYEYLTQIIPCTRKSKMGQKYAMRFERGEKLNLEAFNKMGDELKRVYDNITLVDGYYKESAEAKINKDSRREKVGNSEDVDTIEYPEDDINPDDIPF